MVASLRAVPGAQFAIQIGVPIVADARGAKGKGPFRLALEALAAGPIGASFFIPSTTFTSTATASRQAIAIVGTGWFSRRKVEGGQRIWKIAEPKKRPA